jgi:tetratricopeptide (TPR) repeat protein
MRTGKRLLTLLLTAPLGFCSIASWASPSLQDDRGSLQDLARAARAQRLADLARIDGQVTDAITRMTTAVKTSDGAEVQDIQKELVRLGPAAAELLVPHIDPGEEELVPISVEGGEVVVGNSESQSRRLIAGNVVEVLLQIQSAAITDDLLDMVRKSNLRAAGNALRVLARSPEPERVVPDLEDILNSERGQDVTLRGQALMTLSQLGGPEATAYLTAALKEDNPDLVSAAMKALALTANREAAPAVLTLLNSQGSQIFLRELLGYYIALPDLCVREHQKGLVDLATRRTLPRQSGALVLDTLRELDLAPDRSIKKKVEDLQDAPNRDLSEAAMAWLASRGERSARRRLLAGYDQFVEEDDKNPQGYLDRAKVLYRIRDYGDALRDYRRVISSSRQAARSKAAYTGAAKCSAQLGKFKDAQDLLQRSPLTTSELSRLASDRAFKQMILKDKYRGIFQLGKTDS